MTPSSHISQSESRKLIFPILFLFLTASWITAGCTSKHTRKTSTVTTNDSTLTVLDDTTQIKDLVSLASPGNSTYLTGGVYIDSVEKVIHHQQAALLIHGNLPSGCSSLLKVEHVATGDTLKLHMRSWKPKNKMCTQQLVPFAYLYIPNMTINDLDKMQFCNVNGQIVPLKP